MNLPRGIRTLLLTACAMTPIAAWAQAPIAYRLSFPAPEHRWMQVEMTVPDLPPGPLELRMSRSSPGRYAVHEFAKNVYDVHITDAAGGALAVARPGPNAWDVATHPAVVRVAYKVFGDRIDGTYLGVDTTHAHINMPAVIMWARGLDRRPITIGFEPPTGTAWNVATQLIPGNDPRTFTSPNLQYLMDSPTEFSAFAMRTFTVPDGPRTATFRVAIHHQGSDADVQAFARDAEVIVRTARQVFGTFPAFDAGTYTFIADYMPWGNGDAMEHRNSTFLTSGLPLAQAHDSHMESVSHEFFHVWNVERIRPRSLEPFNFEDANMSGELWLAEGVTNYYGPLVLRRAGLMTLADFTETMAQTINTVTLSPARQLRTAEEMSQFAPYVDAATAIDPTNFDRAFISYYTWGEAIGLGLDLTLRDRSNGTVTLDDFMRAMWQQFGTSAERTPGYVERPYTMADVKAVLGTVARDDAFAADFFARYIQGHDVVDYRRLLALAGFTMRPSRPGAAYAGDLRLQLANNRVRVAALVPQDSPAYAAGLERDDLIVSLAGIPVTRVDDFAGVLQRQKPGAAVPITFLRRGVLTSSTIRLVEDPRQEIVPVETLGQTLTEVQRRFRDGWLSSRPNQ